MSRQGRGFITVACNNKDINYLENAYYLAASVKETQQNSNVTVLTDQRSLDQTSQKIQNIFDNIIIVENLSGFDVETVVWAKSPYKQTIKIEADCILPTSIDHWWDILDQKDVVLTNQVSTYYNEIITNRSQRKLFDDNNLPDVYSAFYYFRYSLDSRRFFNLVSNIFNNWEWFKNQYLKNCRYEYPVTDEVFAIAAKIYGIENCTLTQSVPSFVHMKNVLNNLPVDDDWWNYVYFEKNEYAFNIGHIKQMLPLHYQNKNFISQLKDHYER
jgi:hypothetical protein